MTLFGFFHNPNLTFRVHICTFLFTLTNLIQQHNFDAKELFAPSFTLLSESPVPPKFVCLRTNPEDIIRVQALLAVVKNASSTPAADFADVSTYCNPFSCANTSASSFGTTRRFTKSHLFPTNVLFFQRNF